MEWNVAVVGLIIMIAAGLAFSVPERINGWLRRRSERTGRRS